jgi:hypothetical protein
LPDKRYFVFHSGTGRWSAFDEREDALIVARLVTRGWIQVDILHPLPTISLVLQAL